MAKRIERRRRSRDRDDDDRKIPVSNSKQRLLTVLSGYNNATKRGNKKQTALFLPKNNVNTI